MRAARALAALPGVEAASLVIGTPSNKAQLKEAGLLAAAGAAARPDDLVIAVRAHNAQAASRALAEAERLLASLPLEPPPAGLARAHGFCAARAALPEANLALVSVPGPFAAAEARRALEAGMHAMVFSDNVPLEEEVALKRLARRKGLLLMGPDCGSAIIGGVPLGFANAVPRGDVGIVSASGTGLQEVSTLLARAGRGVSHAIGVGGRDLSEAVGGLTTFAALEALEADRATRHVVVISKPPAPAVARALLARIARSRKRATLCLLGARALRLPRNAEFAPTLLAAAERVAGRTLRSEAPEPPAARSGAIRGLFCGGTLCAEAQLVLLQAGLAVRSNVPVPGAGRPARHGSGHLLLDLGEDAYTRARPHPMIEPELRAPLIAEALADPRVAVLLLDVVIGYGAHPDPAGAVAQALARARRRRALVIASVTGTDADPQGYARQVARLREAGVKVAGSNAEAAALAAACIGARADLGRAESPSPAAAGRSAAVSPGRRGAPRRG